MRPSKVDKLEASWRHKIMAWRADGETVDQIRDKLSAENLPPEAMPGRTAISLYLRKLDQAMEIITRGQMAVARLGRSFEEYTEAREARLNIELLGNLVTERLIALRAEEAAKIDPKEIHEWAQVIHRLVRAERHDTLARIAARKAREKEAAQAAAAAPKKAPADIELTQERIFRTQAKLAGVPYELWVEVHGHRIVRHEDGSETVEPCAEGPLEPASGPLDPPPSSPGGASGEDAADVGQPRSASPRTDCAGVADQEGDWPVAEPDPAGSG
jgi:hypothetical protein